ncbi:MAG: hypothetical protein J0L75_00200 [Spirochaetes bacterium]|nr:hypothetical protein [Spirochaetota bacterium]
MKKHLLWLLLASVFLFLVGCKAMEKAVVDDDDLKKTDANQRLKEYENRKR